MGLLAFFGCQRNTSPEGEKQVSRQVSQDTGKSQGLDKYWHQGKAEISRYRLEQNRYRDVHPGEAILIFVKEDFLTDKQVKNESNSNSHSVPILKLNAIHRFVTGIYDYSVMSSVFTPSDLEEYPHTLKVSNSSQDWCGQTFMQINQIKRGYRVQWNSYFEKEADAELRIPLAHLEDGFWTRLRIDPLSLPTGKIAVLPSAAYFRLMHKPLEVYEALAERGVYEGTDFSGSHPMRYKLVYPGLQRTLEIVYESDSPHQILGWKETYPALGDKEMRTTVATRTHAVLSEYWKQNGAADRVFRQDLGLEAL